MAFITKIKIKAINNLSDARYFASLGVDWLGFNMDERIALSLSIPTAREIKQWIAGLPIVAELGDPSAGKITEVWTQLSPDFIQVNNVMALEETKTVDCSLFYEITVYDSAFLTEVEKWLTEKPACIYAVVVNIPDIRLLDHHAIQNKFRQLGKENLLLLDTSWNRENLLRIVPHVIPCGIVLSSSIEVDGGIRSYDAIEQLMEVLEEE